MMTFVAATMLNTAGLLMIQNALLPVCEKFSADGVGENHPGLSLLPTTCQYEPPRMLIWGHGHLNGTRML